MSVLDNEKDRAEAEKVLQTGAEHGNWHATGLALVYHALGRIDAKLDRFLEIAEANEE